MKHLFYKCLGDSNYSRYPIISHNLSLKSSQFIDLKTLKVLDLSHSQISSIEAGSFVQLENLESLYLHHNYLENFKSNCFKGLVKLKHLGLSFCNSYGDVILEDNCFSDLTKLEELQLNNNPMNDLRLTSKIFKGLVSLLYLTLDSCHILMDDSTEEGCFSDLQNLRKLNLRNNRIPILKKSLFKGLSSLTTIYLSHCEITKIEKDCFVEQTKLRHLELNNNWNLSIMRLSLFMEMKELKELHINPNQVIHHRGRPIDHCKFRFILEINTNNTDFDLEN